ncbi:TAXI family TRAP transporter solute-binding subunit [Vannielia litorea]|nr:TAXI family TRAP transporter solute-binding subunit [Vannielia litorea]
MSTVSAFAEPASIATSRQGSSTHNLGLAISTVAAETSGLDIRPLPFQATSQAIPMIDTGEIAFGLDNAYALLEASTGRGAFDGFQQSQIRLVARLLPLRMTVGVRAESDIQSVADLKGKRIPSGFGTTVTGELLISSFLGTGGLTYDDVERVPVSSFSAMADAFIAGDIDAYIFVIGSPRDANVSVQVGGLRGLDLDDSPESLATVKGILPVGTLYELEPAENLVDINDTTTVLQYDYFVYTGASAADAEVTGLLEALNTGKGRMEEMVASLSWFDPAAMYADVPMPYHPAAIAFFEAQGIPKQ